jgi:hypothetical protein
MSAIRIDMFEVQLGAAVLLQFQTEDGIVRILADAGIKASGYRPDHVLNKLLAMLGDDERRIDLIIGTHYDEDHLNGLVPIIEHEAFDIGEAWLPPIANDSVPHALDALLTEEDLLPHQFRSDAADRYLAEYMGNKRADVETLLVLEGRRPLDEGASLTRLKAQLSSGEFRSSSLGEGGSGRAEELGFFREQLSELVSEDDCDHGTEQETEVTAEVEEAVAAARRAERRRTDRFWDIESVPNLDRQLVAARYVREWAPDAGAAQMMSLMQIRKGAAKDAINAGALHEVVTALRKRDIPIRTHIIPDGQPRQFAWDAASRRFAIASDGSAGPRLTLLGPSNGLVRKHWNRLPVEQATRVALSFLAEIKSITPSNQLSYIARLEHGGQGILISGDAGCVDFKLSRAEYHPALLAAMLPLHVVQVAHHAGNNAYFYRVLDAAGYPEQTDPSLLLLSHATDDRHRPSAEFKSFLLGTLKQGDDVRLLSTSRPRPDKVAEFRSAFHPVVGTAGDEGDVTLTFDGSDWEVKAHAVSP